MYFWLIIGGVALLLIIWIITLFQTPWQTWRHKQGTTRKEPQKWKRDPFEKIR